MKEVKKPVIVYTAVFAVILSLFSGCGKMEKKEMAEDAVVTFVFGDVKIKRNGNDLKAKLKERLRKGDIILTGEKSFIVIRMGERTVFKIDQESDVELKAINRQGENEFYLRQGLVLSKVKKLVKGERYTIKTPTAVASVRGTVFFTEYNNKRTRVAVSRGKVKVRQVSSRGEEYANTGDTVLVAGTVTSRKISAIEKLTLEKIENIPISEKKSLSDEKNIDKNENEIINDHIRIERKIRRMLGKKTSLKEIRSEYGRIDIVTLYNGKKYKGAILSRGKRIQMVTPSGVISIDGLKVRQTESY